MRGHLSFLVQSDDIGHSGLSEQGCTVPQRVKERGTAAICSPVWTGVSVRWAADMDIGTKAIETIVNSNYSPASV